MRGVAGILERREHRSCGLSDVLELGTLPQALEQHVSVANVAEEPGEPAKLLPKRDDHPSSRSGRNVRRSERSRRVATRAWWTPSGSRSSRTIGSWRMRRMTDSAIARRTASPAVASVPRSATAISGVSGVAGASARMYFAV